MDTTPIVARLSAIASSVNALKGLRALSLDEYLGDTLIQAAVLAVDQFGNVITNLRPDDVTAYHPSGGRPCKILVAQREITSFRRTFGDGQPGELFVVPGSAGYLEIVMRDGSAAAELKIKPGGGVGVVFL